MKDAFFGRILLHKCKTNTPDDLDLASDDEKINSNRMAVFGSNDPSKGRDPFEFADSPPPQGFGAYIAGGSNQRSEASSWAMTMAQMTSDRDTTAMLSLAASASGHGLSLPGHEDDSDKDHNIGEY